MDRQAVRQPSAIMREGGVQTARTQPLHFGMHVKCCELTVKEHLAPRFDLVSWAGKARHCAWWESRAAWLHMIKAVP